MTSAGKPAEVRFVETSMPSATARIGSTSSAPIGSRPRDRVPSVLPTDHQRRLRPFGSPRRKTSASTTASLCSVSWAE